jgi:hypothetical protein
MVEAKKSVKMESSYLSFTLLVQQKKKIVKTCTRSSVTQFIFNTVTKTVVPKTLWTWISTKPFSASHSYITSGGARSPIIP